MALPDSFHLLCRVQLRRRCLCKILGQCLLKGVSCQEQQRIGTQSYIHSCIQRHTYVQKERQTVNERCVRHEDPESGSVRSSSSSVHILPKGQACQSANYRGATGLLASPSGPCCGPGCCRGSPRRHSEGIFFALWRSTVQFSPTELREHQDLRDGPPAERRGDLAAVLCREGLRGILGYGQ